VPHRLRTLLVGATLVLGCSSLGVPADALGSSHGARRSRVLSAHRAHGTRSRNARARCRSSAARAPAATSTAPRSARPCRARGHVKSSHALSPRVPLATATPASAGEGHAASIATVLSAPCPNTELTPEAGNLALIRAAILCLVNRERAQNGISPLRLSDQLDRAAEGHSHELIASDYFAHVSPSGETPVERIRATGYLPSPSDGYVIGENLAWGTYGLSTPQAIVSAWIASPEHLANILESQYRETGVGVVAQVPASLAGGAPGATYTQEFGVIVD
jgi:uncharacterized protein YkwD